MKKCLLVLMVLMLLPCMGWATDLNVVLIDSIVGADTANATVRLDTVWSPARRLSTGYFGPNVIHFFSVLSAVPYHTDTNWVDDTFFVKFQTSCDLVTWDTREVDTLLDNGSGWSTLVIDADTSYFGSWGRAMLIHWDTIGSGDSPGIEDNAYYKQLKLWITPKY